MTDVSLSGCARVSDAGVVALTNAAPRLSRLDLTRCPKLTDAALRAEPKIRAHTQTRGAVPARYLACAWTLTAVR